jgi:hypothetical protein
MLSLPVAKSPGQRAMGNGAPGARLEASGGTSHGVDAGPTTHPSPCMTTRRVGDVCREQHRFVSLRTAPGGLCAPAAAPTTPRLNGPGPARAFATSSGTAHGRGASGRGPSHATASLVSSAELANAWRSITSCRSPWVARGRWTTHRLFAGSATQRRRHATDERPNALVARGHRPLAQASRAPE